MRVNKKSDLSTFPTYEPLKPLVESPKIPYPTETYDGKELRPFDGRPGAMDFKKYPSKGLG